LKIAAKPLHIEKWLLLTAYRKLPALYPIVPLPSHTTYHLDTIPHDWHTTVRYDPSRFTYHLKANMRLLISEQ